jgi:hypothetical protein
LTGADRNDFLHGPATRVDAVKWVQYATELAKETSGKPWGYALVADSDIIESASFSGFLRVVEAGRQRRKPYVCAIDLRYVSKACNAMATKNAMTTAAAIRVTWRLAW